MQLNLYGEFLKVIQSKQDKKTIIENMLQGQKYIIFTTHHDHDYPSTLTIRISSTTRTLPSFKSDEFYLPYIEEHQIIPYLNKFLELSLCHSYEVSNYYIKIDIIKTLENFKNNQLPFDSHSISFYNTPKKQKFLETYYDICNYMKDTVKIPEKQKYAFVLNFDFKTTRFNLRIVDQFNFHNFEYLFFLENKKLLQEKSNLIFRSETAAPIDIEMTMKKIDLFNKIKDF